MYTIQLSNVLQITLAVLLFVSLFSNFYTIYKDTSSRNTKYEAEAKRNEDNAKAMEYLKREHEFEMKLYVNKSQQNMEIYKTRWNDCQKDYERCKEEKEKLQNEKSDCISCQHAKNTCVQDKDACQKDYEKCKKEKEKLQNEISNCIYCKHSKDTCVQDKDSCTQQLKEKKNKHEECLNDKENINEQMHRQCSDYQIKLAKCDSSLQHTKNDLKRCEKTLNKCEDKLEKTKTWW